MNYARAFRVTRAMAGLTQATLASRIGVDPSLISLIEKGARKPSTATLEGAARALGVPPHLLLLLAAEAKELRGVTEQEMQRASRSLAEMLFNTPRGQS